ncbi:MAG: hypothetical protein AAF797_05590 [Planctomycetota bacterium]
MIGLSLLQYRHSGLAALLACVMLIPISVAHAEDADSATDAPEKDRSNPPPYRPPLSIARPWNLNWKTFAVDGMVFENQYIVVPQFDRRYPSSAGLSLTAARRLLTAEVGDTAHSAVLRRSYRPPVEELQHYVSTLPRLDVGQYGIIHSVEVEDVLGPTSMVVSELWLIDADAVRAAKTEEREAAEKRGREIDRSEQELNFTVRDRLSRQQRDRKFRGPFRLEGFATRGLSPGQRYRGPDLKGMPVIIAYAELAKNRFGRGRPRHVIIPVEAFVRRGGLTESQFADLLDDRGLTPESFLEALREARDADRLTAEAQVLDSLLPPPPDTSRKR